MNGWLIYSQKDTYENKSYIDWFIEEAKHQKINLQLVLREDLSVGIINNKLSIIHKDESINLPIFVVIRTLEPMLNRMFEASGIHTFNSAAVSQLANNKENTHFYLSKLGLKMVNTLFIKKDNLSIDLPMELPFVVKEATGRGGKEVYLIEDQATFITCKNQLHSNDLIIQSSNVKKGKDLRVYVLGTEIIAAVLRESETDFRANYKLGGSVSLYSLNQIEKKHIYKIINSFKFDLVGIDFLIGLNNELLFNEIEDVVGSRMLSKVSEINLLEKYVAHIIKIINIKTGCQL